jgi:hypothetical protein
VNGEAVGGAGLGEQRAPELALGGVNHGVRGDDAIERRERSRLAEDDCRGGAGEVRREGLARADQSGGPARGDEALAIARELGGEVIELAVEDLTRLDPHP